MTGKNQLNKQIGLESMLTSRQKNLLFAVIKEYCETGQSVGSKEIKDKYDFEFSPATIRNEFATLRDLGFLYQPFTNASNQPTEIAFKLFVNQLIAGLGVTNKRQNDFKKQIIEMQKNQASLNKEISRLLAFQGGGVGFSVDEKGESITGISNLLSIPGEAKVADILDFLDNLDSYKKPLLEGTSDLSSTNQIVNFEAKNQKVKKPIKAIFGMENPVLPLGKGYAMVATEVYVGNKKNVIGLIAPNHLLARKQNLELIEAISNALSDS